MSNLNWISVESSYPEFDEKGYSKRVLVETKRGENFVAYCSRGKHWETKEYVYDWYTNGTGGRRMKVMSSVIAWTDFNRYTEE